MNFPCPKCEQSGISIKDKFRVGYWRETHCAQCNARLCANPWFLAPFSLVYMWLLATCAFLFMFEDVGAMAIVYAVIGWLVIDILNIMLIPMSVMRNRNPEEPNGENPAERQA